MKRTLYSLYYSAMPEWATKYSPPLGEYNYAFYFYRPHKYIVALYDNAKWFIQRGYRGYSDRDADDIDVYLSSWMPLALKRLQKIGHGHPAGLTKKQWNNKLDRMINAFEVAKKIGGSSWFASGEYRSALKQFRNDFDVFKNYYFSLWD